MLVVPFVTKQKMCLCFQTFINPPTDTTESREICKFEYDVTLRSFKSNGT